MAGRCTHMDAPPLLRHGRRVAWYRGACLALGALCLLAALTGTVARSAGVGHHNTHVLAAAATVGGAQNVSHRAAVDTAPAHRVPTSTSAVEVTAAAEAASEPRHLALDTVRTRGPPATTA